ncbi:MAG: ADP-ribosylglycohydrolase family protein [Synergistaceae bacterium]|nr:ADP-ribosylglycohydrolase family protein [Synergistaceae bacterium]
MLGAIVGDVVGSPFEFDNNRETAYSRKYPLVSDASSYTDDTVMTLAVADALMCAMPKKGDETSEAEFKHYVIKSMRAFGKKYPNAGYGGRFYDWLFSSGIPKPYNSWGNGSAMRVSSVAWAFDNLEDVERFAAVSSRVTHNHPEGIKGAQATAAAIFLARKGKSKAEIKHYISEKYYYDLTRTLDEIRPNYHHIESCQQTVPEAITAFMEGENFEDVLRCAVSLSGDSDTLTAIAASIAEGAYGIPDEINKMILPKLDEFLLNALNKWEVWRAN